MAIGASFAERGSNSAISARYSRTKGRLVRILDCDIATEEEPAQVSDRSDAAYPIRRDGRQIVMGWLAASIRKYSRLAGADGRPAAEPIRCDRRPSMVGSSTR
jgi:hypothetical protein